MILTQEESPKGDYSTMNIKNSQKTVVIFIRSSLYQYHPDKYLDNNANNTYLPNVESRPIDGSATLGL